jgi:hypothetical protein
VTILVGAINDPPRNTAAPEINGSFVTAAR